MNIFSKSLKRWAHESFLLISYGSVLVFLAYGSLSIGENLGLFFQSILFLWLFSVILFSSFAIVRHADSLAEELGEPYGTLILTLAVTAIEVIMISALMINGKNLTLARDTMFSVIMILLGGVIGSCLLIGGLRFHEQKFNLKGEKAFMGLILPLSVFSLVLPNFTTGGAGTFSSLHATMMVLLSLMLYAIFLAVQTYWHRDFFVEIPTGNHQKNFRKSIKQAALKFSHVHKESVLQVRDLHAIQVTDAEKNSKKFLIDTTDSRHTKLRVICWHTFWLLLYIPPVLVLSKKMAFVLHLKNGIGSSLVTDSTRSALEGLIVAVLILAPEGMAALRAAWHNHMQRSVNLLLGSVLATISLTVPAVLVVGLLLGQPIHLGLDAAATTLLAVTLGSCMITFSQGQTSLLQGAIHLLLFFVYISLMFE